MSLWIKEHKLAGDVHLLICAGLVVVIRESYGPHLVRNELAYRPDEDGTWLLGTLGYTCNECPVREQCDELP